MLKVLIKDFTVPSVGPIWNDLRIDVTIRPDTPEARVTASTSDSDLTVDVQAALDTFRIQNCVTPNRSHQPGDAWTEQIGPATLRWQVDPESDGTWISYRREVHVTASNQLVSEMTSRVRVDDPWVGTCTLVDHTMQLQGLTPRPSTTRTTSVRVR